MDSFLPLNDVIFNYYFFIGGLFLSYLIYKLLYSLLSGKSHMQTRYRSCGHSWRSIQCNKSIPYSIYCTVCGKLMVPPVGLFCECCAASACKMCRRVVDKKFRCKQITWPSEKAFYHHWVNVGVSRSESADLSDEGMRRFFCTWCHRVKLCQESAFNDSEQCDFQRYKNIIIPPSCVQMDKNLVTGIKEIPDPDWEPLIIFANRKSGSNQSDEVLSQFRGLLNPIQVVDLSTTSPESVACWLPARRCRVLAAGGDGTVAWVLNALATRPDLQAAVGILPMGTGNDLSRTLGWGACAAEVDAHAIIAAVRQAEDQPLDRWRLTITPNRSRLRPTRARSLYVYNYASIGVDAQVALDFHRARTQFLYRYASRSLNYLAYLVLGAGRAVDDGGCSGLERRLRVSLDGVELHALPPLQALVLLNIASWGAGVRLWSMGSADDPVVGAQSVNDGKCEVVGISSSFQIARLQCGLAQPYRFAQAERVKIELAGTCAMQVDGEPWMQGSATITFETAGKCLMLRAANTEVD